MEDFCFLFGHGDCPDTCYSGIEAAIERCILERKCNAFVVGHRGAFDTLATKALQKMKKKYPDVVAHRLLAYYDPFSQATLSPNGFDGTYYPEEVANVPKLYAIVRANQVMVAQCSCAICYVVHDFTNTYKLLQKAQRRNIFLINVGEEALCDETPG